MSNCVFPQMVILIIIPHMRGSSSLNTKNMLKFIVFFQYIPRFIRIYPLYKEVTRTSGILTETAWAGAAFNLFLYMLASHVSAKLVLTVPTFLVSEFRYIIFLVNTCKCVGVWCFLVFVLNRTRNGVLETSL